MDITLGIFLIVVGLIGIVAGWKKWVKQRDAAKAVGVVVLLAGLAFQMGWVAAPLAVTPTTPGTPTQPSIFATPTQVPSALQTADLTVYPKSNGTDDYAGSNSFYVTTLPFKDRYEAMEHYLQYGRVYYDNAQVKTIANTTPGTSVTFKAFQAKIGDKFKLFTVRDSSVALNEEEYNIYDFEIVGYDYYNRLWNINPVDPAVYKVTGTFQTNFSDSHITLGYTDYKSSAASTTLEYYVRPTVATAGGKIVDMVLYVEASDTNVTQLDWVGLTEPYGTMKTFTNFAKTSDYASGTPIRQSAPALTTSTWNMYVVNPDNPVSAVYKSSASTDSKGMIRITITASHPATSTGAWLRFKPIMYALGGTHLGSDLHADFTSSTFTHNMTAHNCFASQWIAI